MHDHLHHNPPSLHQLPLHRVVSPNDPSPHRDLNPGHQSGAIHVQANNGVRASSVLGDMMRKAYPASAKIPRPIVGLTRTSAKNPAHRQGVVDQSQASVINKTEPVVQFHAKSKAIQR